MLDKNQDAVGTEKIVRAVGNEAWATNIGPLDGIIINYTPEWVEASHILGEIANALLPDNFAKPVALEFTFEDDPQGEMQRNVLRRSQLVTGREWEAVDGEVRKKLVNELVSRLQDLGFIRAEALDHAHKPNFLYPDDQTAVYVDTLDPLDPKSDTLYTRTVDPKRLRESIAAADIPEETKQHLLQKLERYMELTDQLIARLPWKRD